MPRPPSRLSAWLLAGAGTVASAYLLLELRRRYWQQTGAMPGSDQEPEGVEHAGEEEEQDDVPEEFLDPISFACMSDPALLCGTGQVYCLRSLRSWLATGSRKCPKSNMTMRDVEVVRLPFLRSRIAAWRTAHGLPPLPPLDPPPEVVLAAGAKVPRLLADLRSGDVFKRGLAAGEVNDLLIEWGTEPSSEQRQVMEAMMLDLVWLLRQGDPYGSGVAAAALAQYEGAEQAAFLAAVAAMPAVALLWSPHSYGQHSAARLLASLVARGGPSMPDVLVEAGATRGLLQQLDLRQPFPYSRCSAAAALAGLCASEAGCTELRAGGGIPLLKAMVLQPEGDVTEGEVLVRFDKRDAAGCLLALELTAEELGEEPAVDRPSLLGYQNCSRAWLHGRVASPTEGYTAGELARRVDRLALGLEGEEGEEEEAAVDGEAEPVPDGPAEGGGGAAGGEGDGEEDAAAALPE